MSQSGAPVIGASIAISSDKGQQESVEQVKRLHATTDAAIWAHEFNKVFAELHEGCELDEGWLIGWFANAIEIGRDAGKRSADPATVPLSAITYAITLLEVEDKDGKALQYLRAVEDKHSYVVVCTKEKK